MDSAQIKSLVGKKECADLALLESFTHGVNTIVNGNPDSSWTLLRSSSQTLDEFAFNYGIPCSSLLDKQFGQLGSEASEKPSALGVLVLKAPDESSANLKQFAGLTVQSLPTQVPSKPGLAATAFSKQKGRLPKHKKTQERTISEMSVSGTNEGTSEELPVVAILACTCKDLRVETYQTQQGHDCEAEAAIQGNVEDSDSLSQASECSEEYKPSKKLQVQTSARVTRQQATRLLKGGDSKCKRNKKERVSSADKKVKKTKKSKVRKGSGSDSEGKLSHKENDSVPVSGQDFHDEDASDSAANCGLSEADDGRQGADQSDESLQHAVSAQEDAAVERDKELCNPNVHASKAPEHENIHEEDNSATHDAQSGGKGTEMEHCSGQELRFTGKQPSCAHEGGEPRRIARVGSGKASDDSSWEEHSNDILRTSGRRVTRSSTKVASQRIIDASSAGTDPLDGGGVNISDGGKASRALRSKNKRLSAIKDDVEKGSNHQTSNVDEDSNTNQSRRKRSFLRCGTEMVSFSGDTDDRLLVVALAGEYGYEPCSSNSVSGGRTRPLQDIDDVVSPATAADAGKAARMSRPQGTCGQAEHSSSGHSSKPSQADDECCIESDKAAPKARQQPKRAPTRSKRKSCRLNQRTSTTALNGNGGDDEAAGKGAATGRKKSAVRTRSSVRSGEDAAVDGTAPKATKRSGQQCAAPTIAKSGSKLRALQEADAGGEADAAMHAEHAQQGTPNHDPQESENAQIHNDGNMHSDHAQQQTHEARAQDVVPAKSDDREAQEVMQKAAEDKEAIHIEKSVPVTANTPFQKKKKKKKKRNKKGKKKPICSPSMPKTLHQSPKRGKAKKSPALPGAANQPAKQKRTATTPEATPLFKDMHAHSACKEDVNDTQQQLNHCASGEIRACTPEATLGAKKPCSSPDRTDKSQKAQKVIPVISDHLAEEPFDLPTKDVCMSPTESVARGGSAGGHKRRRCSIPEASDIRMKKAAWKNYLRPDIAARAACMRPMHGGVQAVARVSAAPSPDGEVQSAAQRVRGLHKVAAGATAKKLSFKKVAAGVPATAAIKTNRGAKALAQIRANSAKEQTQQGNKALPSLAVNPVSNKTAQAAKLPQPAVKRARVLINTFRRSRTHSKKVLMKVQGRVVAKTLWPVPRRRIRKADDVSEDDVSEDDTSEDGDDPPDDEGLVPDQSEPGNDAHLGENPEDACPKDAHPESRPDAPPDASHHNASTHDPPPSDPVEPPSDHPTAPSSDHSPPLVATAPVAATGDSPNPSRSEAKSSQRLQVSVLELSQNPSDLAATLHRSSPNALSVPSAVINANNRAPQPRQELLAGALGVRKSTVTNDRIQAQNQALRAHRPKLSAAKLIPPDTSRQQALAVSGAAPTPKGPNTPSLLAASMHETPSATRTCNGFPLTQSTP